MKILLVNYHSSNNIGDSALIQIIIRQLRHHFPKCTIRIAMNDPNSYDNQECVLASFSNLCKEEWGISNHNWNIFPTVWLLFSSFLSAFIYRKTKKISFFLLSEKQKNLLSGYIDADIVASVAGNPLYSSGKIGIQFLISFYTLAFAIFLGKPTYLFPQSIGPFRRNWERIFIRWIVNRSRVTMIRDSESANFLKNIRVHNEKTIQIPDLCFAMVEPDAESAVNWLENQGVDFSKHYPIIGVTAIDWSIQNQHFYYQKRYEESIINAVSIFLEKTGGIAIIFSQVTGSSYIVDDMPVAKKIHSGIIAQGQNTLLAKPVLSPQILFSAYGMLDIFLGTRMHSNIFALTQMVPSLAISYLYKTQGMMHDLGFRHWVIDINEVYPQILTKKLLRLWYEKDQVKKELSLLLPSYKFEADKAGLLIEKDYKMYISNIIEA